MRRAFLAVFVVALMGLTAQVASASTNGAHFMSVSASVNDGGALVVSWDEAGLGNENIDYTLNADATATYACINNGGKHPKASNKENVADQVSSGGSFQAKNCSRETSHGKPGPPPTPAVSVTSTNFLPSTLRNRWCLPTHETKTSGRPSSS